MKDFIKTTLLAGIPFGITMGLLSGVMGNLELGIILGTLMGCLFGSLISIFILMQRKKFRKISSTSFNDKEVIIEGPANHFKGLESVGGWLWLTRKEIIFKSHDFNIQNHQTVIPINKITKVATSLTLGLFPNGLKISTSDSDEKFVVNQRNKWFQKINEEIRISSL